MNPRKLRKNLRTIKNRLCSLMRKDEYLIEDEWISPNEIVKNYMDRLTNEEIDKIKNFKNNES
jgi:hypothetical protein